MKVSLRGKCGLGYFGRRLHDVVGSRCRSGAASATLHFLVSAVRNRDDHSVRDGAVSGPPVKSPFQFQTLCQALSNGPGLILTQAQHYVAGMWSLVLFYVTIPGLQRSLT